MDTTLDSLLMPDFEPDFDLESLFQTTTCLNTTSRCNFKECIQTRTTDPYFCSYHSNIVYASYTTIINHPTPPTKKHKSNNYCGAVKCRKEQGIDSYLCDFHFLSLDNEKIKLAFVCREKGCTKVKQLKQKKCIDHL